MQITAQGIADAALAGAVANSVAAATVIILIFLAIYMFGRLVSQFEDSKPTFVGRVATVLIAYMFIMCPALLWFLWNALVAWIAPEYYVLRSLS